MDFVVLGRGTEETGRVPPGAAEPGHLALEEEVVSLFLGERRGGWVARAWNWAWSAPTESPMAAKVRPARSG